LSVNRPTYYEICKYLINCPLAEAFTKTPSVVYQNPLREFWCIVITHNPNPPINDSEARPLKEYLIKFLVMSGKKPLILNYKTFVESTRLDYAKGTYVSHPSLDAVKAKLAKIVENPILLDRTPVLKTTFPMAWRILFTFVIQVLCGYYSSTEQVKSIQQLIAYCLFIGIKVDIGDIIYSDLITRLINKSRQKYVSYPRFVSCALKVLLGYYYTQDESFRSSPTILSNSNFSKDPSKVTPIELTAFIGPEASGSLPQKRKKPKSKKIPTKTQVTPPTGPTEGYEKSHSVSSGNVHDPQDPKRNKQLTGTKLPSTQLDEGTRKSQLLPEGTTTDPKDSKGNVQPADKGLSSMVSDEGTVKTMPLLEGPHGDKDLEGFKPPADMEPLTTPVTSSEVEPDSKTLQLKTFVDVQALLLSDDEMVQESDEDDALYDDPRASIEEDVVSYADLRASIEGYYDENVDHRDQTDKLVKETMKIIDNIIKAGIDEKSKPLKALNIVFETLEADSVLKEEMKKMVESYNTTSGNLSRLTELINNAKLPELLTKLEGGEFRKACYCVAKPPFYTEGEPMQIFTIIKKPEDEVAKTPMEKEPKRPIRAFPISIVKPIIRPNHEVTLIKSSSRPSLTEPILEIMSLNKQLKLRPEPITDVKIHPKLNTCSVYRANDRRNIQVHNPFKFKDFGVTKLDELGLIIQKKKNKIVGELMTSLGKTYEHLKKIPEELGIQSAIPTPKQAQSQSSGRKESIWNWSLKSEFLDWN
ncbi:hypothetical protein Tco_0738441, partial [Tanacetum coccineum]